ncbi:proton-conducting transporter membrane subunit [Cellulosimicrobium arenosum]|uniref:NADH-quinone oxidoreductase subunit L n=1 Tax=Cellulosimicrobium arenosum TaxID=2708133 RepID=A0A927PGD9_9MICO|nr:proton-conducting transporter membrane subunit [Cellulosimicrobium arenosum]MBD8080374.1 NADH-quinone oxidoreductase subunit L [Cellulosimicrobium arenosum]
MSAALLALVLLPASGGMFLLLGRHRFDRGAVPLALVLGVAGVFLAGTAAVTRASLSVPFLSSGGRAVVDGADVGLAVDGLSAVLTVTVAAVALVVSVFAAADHEARSSRARFFGYWLLFVAAMQLTVTATTFPALLVGWELMGATSYALIGFRWRAAGKTAAGTTALLTTRATDLGLYVAAGAVLAGSGSLSLDLVGLGSPWLGVASTGVVLAALGKSAQLPFSGWLSAAMQGPSPVSALLHSATMVAAGGYLLLRLHDGLAGPATVVVVWAGASTALVLGAVAVAQTDLKQLLAASTAAQMGFVVLGAGAAAAGSDAGLLGGAEHLTAHAAVKAGLFVAAGAWLSTLGTKQLAGLRGAARRTPAVGVAAVACAAVLAGIPPLSLWTTKDEVLAGVQAAGLPAGTVLHVVALTAGALSAAYAAKIVALVLAPWRGPSAQRVSAATTVAALVLAASAVALGAVALPAVRDAAADLLGVPPGQGPGVGALVLSGSLALVVGAVVLARPAVAGAFERTSLAPWLGTLALLRAVGRGALGLARAADRTDRSLDHGVMALSAGVLATARIVEIADVRGIDGAVEGAAVGTVGAARRTAVLDDRVLDGAVRRVAGTAGHLGVLARRPQTGLLHQYYAQAAVGVGVLFLVLLIVR